MDISYGGENGFNQAIELSADALQNVKFIQEKKLIGSYFDEISQVIPLSGQFNPDKNVARGTIGRLFHIFVENVAVKV